MFPSSWPVPVTLPPPGHGVVRLYCRDVDFAGVFAEGTDSGTAAEAPAAELLPASTLLTLAEANICATDCAVVAEKVLLVEGLVPAPLQPEASKAVLATSASSERGARPDRRLLGIMAWSIAQPQRPVTGGRLQCLGGFEIVAAEP
jgi:hypothetical protein